MSRELASDERRELASGRSESQAEGQAEALAAAMTDTLATKQDLNELRHEFRELHVRMEAGFVAAKESMRELELRINARFEHLERQFDTRLGEQNSGLDAKLANLERRVTVRMLAGIAAVSALAKLL